MTEPNERGLELGVEIESGQFHQMLSPRIGDVALDLLFA